MKNILSSLFALAAALAFSAPAVAASQLILGVFPYLSPARLIELHLPLRGAVAAALSRPVEMVTAPDFPSFVERTRNGAYDVILTAPHMGRLAETRDGYVPIVMSGYRVSGVFLVPKGSAIGSLADLRGKTLMAPEPYTIVYQMAAAELGKQGLEPGKTLRVLHSHTHNNALGAPLRGEADASVVGSLVWKSTYADTRLGLRPIGATAEMPGLVVLARKMRLSPSDMESLRRALLAFHATAEGARYLAATGLKRFLEVDATAMASLDPYMGVFQRERHD